MLTTNYTHSIFLHQTYSKTKQKCVTVVEPLNKERIGSKYEIK